MKYLSIIKIYNAEYRYGEYMGRRLHCYSTNREIIAYCRGVLSKGKGNLVPDKRAARKALYLGAMKACADERALCREFRL